MSTIGTFSKTENGFTGVINTLTLKTKVQIVEIDALGERSPNYRVFSGNAEIGAAWDQTARDTNRDYVSVKIDDPSLSRPFVASLFKSDDGESYNLIWSRRADA